MSHPQPLL
ncbi:hypothetical protein LEMLEM_LOCUS27026 [Lemmus lemmus]